MKITSVLNININNVPVTSEGKQVYEALLTTGARTTEELLQHLDMSDGMVDLMLAHLMRHDIVKIEVENDDN